MLEKSEKNKIPCIIVGVHQVSTYITILFQTTNHRQTVLAGDYPENCQISDSGQRDENKIKNVSVIPNGKWKDNLPVHTMGSVKDGVLIEDRATARLGKAT
jgi:hypothetical protein